MYAVLVLACLQQLLWALRLLKKPFRLHSKLHEHRMLPRQYPIYGEQDDSSKTLGIPGGVVHGAEAKAACGYVDLLNEFIKAEHDPRA